MERADPSRAVLRVCMQVLVLLDLAFVHMTGAAGLHWLLPLFALALVAPLLERFRERPLYRLLWNGAVVAVFFGLLRHALRAELASVLEDGLVLAVLCQVHLLNNLRSDQRPDLLFFNAFLIAIMTGFMSRGLGFPIAFLAFVPCFAVGLQFLNATRDGRSLSPRAARRLALDGARRATVLLAASGLVFLFWPRDFERKAYFHGTFEMPTGGGAKLEVGFDEKLLLDRSGRVGRSNRPALRVTVLEGTPAAVPLLWRGATLGETSGRGWQPLGPAPGRGGSVADLRWRYERGRFVRDGAPPGSPTRVEVVRFEQGTERLFAPLEATELRLAPGEERRRLRPRSDGTIDVAETREVAYELALAPGPSGALGGARRKRLTDELLPFVELPEGEHEDVSVALEIAATLSGRVPADADQHALVTELSEHLSRTYAYVPPGGEGAARTLDEFLRGGAGGHCELFAASLAVMLRGVDVPCRVVTGFRASRWDAEGRVLSVGTRDAHAWVEVLDPRGGWYAVDPTPALAEQLAGASFWTRLRTSARSAWETVTDFDAERRAAFQTWLRTLPARAGAAFRARPLAGTLVVLLPGLLGAWWLRRRRARIEGTVRAYRRALRRANLRLLPGETPRELLSRARRVETPPARLAALEAATHEHEAARYAARSSRAAG